MYVLERVLYRLSVSEYRDYFSLKGGILLYGMFDDFSRITTDIDLLGNMVSNDADNITKIFNEILQIECDDVISFDLNSMEAKNITEFKDYHGVNLSLDAYMDRTRIPVNIDIGFGDVIYPQRQIMDYPVILDDEAPVLYVYSKESIVAEKLEAIVSLGTLNSRYKDFYDICILSEQSDFKGSDLQEAIIETFTHRGTSLTKIGAFSEGFSDDETRIARWNGFIKTKHVNEAMTLDQAIIKIRSFAEPVISSIKDGNRFDMTWSHSDRKWS